MNRVLKNVYRIAGALCILYSLFVFRMNIGWIWLPIGIVLLLAGYSDRMHLPRWLRVSWRAVLSLGVALVLVLEGFILSGMTASAPAGVDYLIVLGAKVRDGRPSMALQHRIDAAAEYLLQNPDTMVIASGGQGKDEAMSEAQCIKEGLIAAGIDESRILLEDQSTNTVENLAYSAKLIGTTDVSVAVVSNNYHIYRAMLLARNAGFGQVYGIAASYGSFTLPHFLVREAISLIVSYLTGDM